MSIEDRNYYIVAGGGAAVMARDYFSRLDAVYTERAAFVRRFGGVNCIVAGESVVGVIRADDHTPGPEWKHHGTIERGFIPNGRKRLAARALRKDMAGLREPYCPLGADHIGSGKYPDGRSYLFQPKLLRIHGRVILSQHYTMSDPADCVRLKHSEFLALVEQHNEAAEARKAGAA